MGKALAAVICVFLSASGAFSQSASPGPQAPALTSAGSPSIGMAKTSGLVLAVDAAAGTLRLKDRAGMIMEFQIGPDTKVVRAGKTLKLSDISVRGKVMLLRYDRRTRQALRIELSRR